MEETNKQSAVQEQSPRITFFHVFSFVVAILAAIVATQWVCVKTGSLVLGIASGIVVFVFALYASIYLAVVLVLLCLNLCLKLGDVLRGKHNDYFDDV